GLPGIEQADDAAVADRDGDRERAAARIDRGAVDDDAVELPPAGSLPRVGFVSGGKFFLHGILLGDRGSRQQLRPIRAKFKTKIMMLPRAERSKSRTRMPGGASVEDLLGF